jgi:four helix bundle protein
MLKQNIILEKSIDFSVSVIKFCEGLEKQKKYVVANQLIRCGTGIGANIFETQHAESKADFIHKMKIAIKEANETRYRLTLCERCESYQSEAVLKEAVMEMIKIL